MGLFHFKPTEESVLRKIFLHLYARFELLYVRFNWLILKHAYPSRFWRRFFMPLIYLNVYIMLKWGQHGQVMSVKEVQQFLDDHQDVTIAVGSCRCRLGTPNVCDCPMNTDITIQTGADIYSTHFSHDYTHITKEEAITRITRFNKQSLLPIAYSFCLCGGARHVFVLCNCCVHACIPLLAQKIGGFHMVDPGKYMPRIQKEKCVGCGTCVDTCQVNARNLKNEKSQVDPIQCLGCGACAQNCPENATIMVQRPKEILKKQTQPLTSFTSSLQETS